MKKLLVFSGILVCSILFGQGVVFGADQSTQNSNIQQETNTYNKYRIVKQSSTWGLRIPIFALFTYSSTDYKYDDIQTSATIIPEISDQSEMGIDVGIFYFKKINFKY